MTTAYLAGGGPILNAFIGDLTGFQFPKYLDSLPLLLLFGYFIYHGTHSVDYINRVLMAALAFIYLLIVFLIIPSVDAQHLRYSNPKMLWVGSSVVATSFGFHIIIPTLTAYLHRDVKQLKTVLIIGSVIPLVVYLVWQAMVLGIIPLNGPISIHSAYSEGTNGVNVLGDYLGHGLLPDLARIFSLLVIITSFLGVSMSLSDFLADGLQIQKTKEGKWLILFLTFAPPIAFAVTDPRAFLSALEYAGAFGVMLLLGILPALMVWKGRKRYGSSAPYRAPGGRFPLLLTILFCLLVMGIEICEKIGVLTL